MEATMPRRLIFGVLGLVLAGGHPTAWGQLEQHRNALAEFARLADADVAGLADATFDTLTGVLRRMPMRDGLTFTSAQPLPIEDDPAHVPDGGPPEPVPRIAVALDRERYYRGMFG